MPSGLPDQLTRGLLAYLCVALLAAAAAFVCEVRVARVAGLHRTVHGLDTASEVPLLTGVARDLTLDFLAAERDLPNRFRVFWRGLWFVPDTRVVRVSVDGDDPVTVWVDGRRLVRRQHHTLTLTAGFHSLAVEYEHQGGTHRLEVSGSTLKSNHLFRSPPTPAEMRLVRIAPALTGAAAVLWLAPMVMAFPMAVGAMVLLLPQLTIPVRLKAYRCRARLASAVAARQCTHRYERAGSPSVAMVAVHRFLGRSSIDRTGIEAVLRRLLPFVLGVFFVNAVIHLTAYYQHRHGFVIGDWLINYQDGFVRRGLLGEALYGLHRATGVNPGLYVLLLQVFLQLTFLSFSYLLLRRQSLASYAPLVCAPFVFLYHGDGGFRKEELFLALMAFSMWLLQRPDDGRTETLFRVVLCAYPLVVLSHEMLFAFMPYLAAAYVITRQPGPARVMGVLWLCSLSALALAVLLLYGHADRDTSERIRESLALADYPIEEGAMAFLGDSTSQAYRRVSDVIVWGNYSKYLLVVVLVGAGFLPLRHRCRAVRDSPLCLAMVVAAIALTMPLFAVAMDWGRLIRIHGVALFLLTLGGSSRRDRQHAEEDATARATRVPVLHALGRSLAFIAYVSFWQAPHWGAAPVLVSDPYPVMMLRRSLGLVCDWL